MVSSWRHKGTLQRRNNRNSHLPWVPPHLPNPLLLLLHQSTDHRRPPLSNLATARNSLNRRPLVWRCRHRRHHLFQWSLLRPRKQLHLVSQLHLHKHPSPRKGKLQRSRSSQLVVKCQQKPIALKRYHLRLRSLRLQQLRRLRKRKAVRRGPAKTRSRGPRQASLRLHLRRG